MLSDVGGVLDGSVSIWHGMDLMGEAPDHLPLIAKAKFYTEARFKVARRRTVRYDRKAVAKAADAADPLSTPHVAALEAAILAVPLAPTHIDPSSHEHICATHFEQCLVDHFPRPQRPIRQSYLSGSSDALVDTRSKMLTRFNGAGLRIKRAAVWFCLRVWYSFLPRRHMWMPTWYPARGPVTPQLCFIRMNTGRSCDSMDKCVSDSVAVGFAILLAAKADDLVNAALMGDARTISKLLKAMKQHNPRILQMLRTFASVCTRIIRSRWARCRNV